MDNNNNDKEKSLEMLFSENEDGDYSYEKQKKGYNRSNHMRMARYRRNRTKKTVLMILVAVVLLTLWIIAAVSIVKHVNGTDTTDPTDTSNGTDSSQGSTIGDNNDSSVNNGDNGTDNALSYTSEKMGVNAYKTGKLILINSTYKYDYTADTYLTKELVSAYSYANGAFSVSYQTDKIRIDTIKAMNEMFAAFKAETGLTGFSLRPDYAYCTHDQQQAWYDATEKKRGESAPSYEFKGGESEHETGRSFDIKVEVNGEAVAVRNADSAYLWIYDNCYKYGIVYRYPSDKTAVTGVSMAADSTHADHFRYVGKAAAAAMHANNWCLEEFIIEIEKYTYNGEHLKAEGADGTKYEMYFYPATAGADTEVKVPEGMEYEISGNNIDGYIVTVTTQAATAAE